MPVRVMAAPFCGAVRYRTVACSATVHSVNMTQKGALSERDTERLLGAKIAYEESLLVGQWYRETVVEMVDKSSYREVARLTGLSTNTLQRWKRESKR